MTFNIGFVSWNAEGKVERHIVDTATVSIDDFKLDATLIIQFYLAR